MKHANIALFVANIGCPNMCSFCNQHIISGAISTARPEDVGQAIEIAKQSGLENGQLAFFGGSFTAIPREYMISLLEAAKPYIIDGSISGIRISTRPDAIDDEILRILKDYGVEAIELGAQSMVDEVLSANRRGHTSNDVRRASALIKSYSFELGLQMMTGLYKDTDEGAIYTAHELVELEPDTVRIYPTIVLQGTELDYLYKQGLYVPQTLDVAVSLCTKLLEIFTLADIDVIRMGLHSGGNVEEGYVAGAYHPAFRELCESGIYLSKVKSKIITRNAGTYKIVVNEKEISKMVGQKKKNIIELSNLGYKCTVCADNSLNKYDFVIEEEEK